MRELDRIYSSYKKSLGSNIKRLAMVALWVLPVCAGLPDRVAEAALQCFECHGDRTTQDIRPKDTPFRNPSTGGFPGNHRTHMGAPAVQNDCAKCHPGSDSFTSAHRNGQIKVSSRINNSPVTTSYNNATSAFPQTSNHPLESCSKVNCHFEAITPPWGSDPAQTSCGTCHSSPPSDGKHGGKHGQYFGNDTHACARCHPDHLSEQSGFAHATSAGRRPLSVQFKTAPNSGGSYGGPGSSINYPGYLPSQNPARNGTCTGIYCHSDGCGGPPTVALKWSDATSSQCYHCHKGRAVDSTPENCAAIQGIWSSSSGICTPDLTMSSNGHHRLVGPQWIRKYPCYYCHNATANALGNISSLSRHVNGSADIAIAPQWNIAGRPVAGYNSLSKVCDNVYCHSDGTTDPDAVRPFAWTRAEAQCNSCHGHPTGSCSSAGCHDNRTDGTGKVWPIKTGWDPGKEWMGALPMFPNQGPGTARANSHPRHVQTNFTCDICHAKTIKAGGNCPSCHANGIPAGSMSEVTHLDGAYHVNKSRDVVFRADVAGSGASYNQITKTCSNVKCHTGGTDPVWGGTVNNQVICFSCHGTTAADVDSFGFTNFSTQAKINMNEWATTGHGRYSSAANTGKYPWSGNRAANFPGNGCWYCHDNNVLHNDQTNPFRLRQHTQYSKRFDKECVYCHMDGSNGSCLGCHNSPESLAPQIAAIFYSATARWPDGTGVIRQDHGGYTSCTSSACHYVDPGNPTKDMKVHNTGAGFWTTVQMQDVKNQYLMMGVCLQCHDDDSNGQCSSCHTAPADNPLKYSVGFDPGIPGTGFIKPVKARASGSHFGYKHYKDFLKSGGWTYDANGNFSGTWKGGKFCWDCHDPHGDSNIYMIQDSVATTTDGKFGIPKTRAAVSFKQKQSGMDYARSSAPYNGICNVCHSDDSRHYQNNSGDGHNAGKVCTSCHEHRFSDSHASGQACNTCHANSKPVPKHAAFSLPRDCTKCHAGAINQRMDIMTQMNANSHHVQGVAVNNKHCYSCHWEADPNGLIDVRYHDGFDFKNYSTVPNAKVDLVVWKASQRPTYYNTTTVVQFLAKNIGTANERSEAAKVSNHCLGCHSDQNNDTDPFGDCKTPRQYAWDGQSVAARYRQTGTTPWGKVNSTTYPNANQKDKLAKAFSAHGNAAANQGGYSLANGVDSSITDRRRNGGGQSVQNVQCYDCHSSHGSKVVGTTSSYVTFNGTRNGGNLKETQAGKGGYSMSYKASANTATNPVNPYSAGAGQCFDCHMTPTANSGATPTPWGFNSTFGVISSVKGYFDSAWFGGNTPGVQQRYAFKKNRLVLGGHMKASSMLNYTTAAQNKINGLCTPCHDPHGVSPTLGSLQAYAVPLLKGTWMSSPYREDAPIPDTANPPGGGPNPTPAPTVNTDQNTFAGVRISETDSDFAGLCLRCHNKGNLTAGPDKSKPWKGIDRIHQSVKGWGVNDQHSYNCAKCHTPHTSGLPRLMITNCLDYRHRGRQASGGTAGSNGALFQYYYNDGRARYGSFPRGMDQSGVNCHPAGAWPNNYWNVKTPWP